MTDRRPDVGEGEGWMWTQHAQRVQNFHGIVGKGGFKAELQPSEVDPRFENFKLTPYTGGLKI